MRFPMLQPVTEMTVAALGPRLAPGVEGYLDMFHDDAVFEFPYAPAEPRRVEGKAAMASYLATLEGTIVFERFDLDACHPIEGAGMVMEYRSQARLVATDERFEQEYVAVIETTGGRIGRYREYYNPANLPGA
ncbi:nuclear transport factor 2 family protein [Sphingomonas sp.]|uniref:nuclear transport factor 2 family protein n=1 Tax=Sphingomonas sp. TaxID=28214 RepID=UPI003AFF7E32